MKNQKNKGPKVDFCVTPAGPCVSAEGPDLRPVAAVVGGLAAMAALVALVRALEDL